MIRADVINPVQPKVKAGAKSIMASTPGAIFIVWLLGQMNLEVTNEVAVAISGLFVGGVSFVTSYLKKGNGG